MQVWSTVSVAATEMNWVLVHTDRPLHLRSLAEVGALVSHWRRSVGADRIGGARLIGGFGVRLDLAEHSVVLLHARSVEAEHSRSVVFAGACVWYWLDRHAVSGAHTLSAAVEHALTWKVVLPSHWVQGVISGSG